MRLICETVVKDILPAVRSLIAKELQEDGYTQTEIAGILGITQPAVSQYLSAARGKKVQRIRDDEESYMMVQDLVEMLVNDADEEEISEEFCNVCTRIRNSGMFEEAFDASEDIETECRLRKTS
ncbi:MAG: transcriptional regulator [Candidatus Nanohaloarchaea archaeon]|nr:transcriptional regulator [Candidatus Nanohaloarchaea archaeon]